MSTTPPPTPDELILAMLREVLARQARQMGLTARPEPPVSVTAPAVPVPAAEPSPSSQTARPSDASAPPGPAVASPSPGVTPPPLTAPGATFGQSLDLEEAAEPLSRAEALELAEFEELAARPFLPSKLPRTLRWLVAGLIVIVILINLPVFSGLALARALPDRQALILRDGLLLKGSGPEVYVLQQAHRRWISSLDAFEYYGYRWDEVHVVDDDFLNQFPEGKPIHVLLKCDASPHIYRLENDKKRWIQDVPTFLAEGHVWEDVRFVSCSRLRSIPDGPPIPPDAGPAPQP